MECLYDVREAAQALKVSQPTIRRYVAEGRMTCTRVGGSVRFTEDDLRSVIHRREPHSLSELVAKVLESLEECATEVHA